MNQFNLSLHFLSLGFYFLAHSVSSLEVERICGGRASCQGDFSYVVSIQKFGKSICSGSILNSNKILTAAHCVCNSKGVYTGLPYKVFAGKTDLKAKKTGIIISVHKIYVHAHYLPERSLDDIAILELEENLDLVNRQDLATVKIPPPDFQYKRLNRRQAVIAGFGWDWIEIKEDPKTHQQKEYGGIRESKMKYAMVEIVPNSECKEKNVNYVIAETHICAQVVQQYAHEVEGVCSGDSGAPLVVVENSMAIGILSASPFGCNESLIPAVYTRTAPYSTFINDIMDERPNEDTVIYNAVISMVDNLRRTLLRISKRKYERMHRDQLEGEISSKELALKDNEISHDPDPIPAKDNNLYYYAHVMNEKTVDQTYEVVENVHFYN